MPFPFLSPEWLEAARGVYERHAGGTDATRVGAARINQTVTGVPFGEGTMAAHVDTTSGVVVLEEGHLPDAAVTITVDYDTARSLFVDQDPGAGMQAFLAGKIVIQGDMTELLKFQALLGTGSLSEAGREIREITA